MHYLSDATFEKQNKTVDFSTTMSDIMDFESALSTPVPVGYSNIRSPTSGKVVLCMVVGHLRM